MSRLLQKNKRHRLLLWLIFLYVLVMGIMTIAVPPGVDPDSCWGFMVMHSMELGNRFNLLVTPNPANIATNQSIFLSWWSPGQYLLPYFFKALFKVNTGHAVSVTVAACYLCGLSGFYKLFKQLGFTNWVSAISIAFIATQQFFIQEFVYYNGGEVLLFAFMGWFLYGCFSFKKLTWQVLIFVFFAGLLGFFSKSSVLWMYATGAACIWINVSVNQTKNSPDPAPEAGMQSLKPSRFKHRIRLWARNGILIAIPFLAAIFIIYLFYLSNGSNPASETGKILIKPETFSFPLASPLISGFSIDEMLDGLIYQPDGARISYHTVIFILYILALLSLLYIITIVKLSPDKKYSIAMLSFFIAGTVFFSYMFLKQASITYEGRHFRIIGLLAIPGIVYLCFKTRLSKILFFVIWIIFLNVEYRYFRDEYEANITSPRSTSGLCQQIYDQATLNEIAKIDHQHHNDAIFVVMSSDIGSEISNNRVITVEADDMSTQDISRLKYSGIGGPIYVLIPASYLTDGRSLNITKSFISYHNFTIKQLSKNYYLYSAIN
jgi:hypothetical protein